VKTGSKRSSVRQGQNNEGKQAARGHLSGRDKTMSENRQQEVSSRQGQAMSKN